MTVHPTLDGLRTEEMANETERRTTVVIDSKVRPRWVHLEGINARGPAPEGTIRMPHVQLHRLLQSLRTYLTST
jgi:hypothetical protein